MIYIERITRKNRDSVLKLYKRIYSSKRDFTMFMKIMKKPSHVGFCGHFENKLICFISAIHILGEIDIIELSVTQESRRRGIGYKLVSYLQQYSIQNGVEKVFLNVANNNIAAISLYEKAGFNKIRIRKNYYMLDGFSVDGYEYCWNMTV